MTELPRYAAFISYASADAPFAQRLHGALERYRIPKALGKFVLTDRRESNRIYPVFRDREELSAGNLGERIEASLRNSGALIVVCSPHAAASPWVQKEIEYFASLGRRDRIFAIIHDKAPLADSEGADATPLCFPAAIRGDAIADASALEPLAADARKGKDGFRNAWLKLVAGLANATPGQLIDRDRQRRRAQMLQAAAVWALVVIGVAAAWVNRPTLEPLAISYTRYRPYVGSNASLLAAAPGTVFQDCRDGSSDCPVMVVIPEGTFIMGAAPEQASDYQGPAASAVDERRRISIARFAVSQHEVTFADWQACVAGGGCHSTSEPSNRGGRIGNRPVIDVSWEDAGAYARWLSQMTGHEYRLLTEAEWEYAARGVTSADDPRNGDSWGFGNDATHLGDYAWFSENSEGQTHAVGTRRANRFGLNDMHGNVWEWVEDCYAPYGQLQQDGDAVESNHGTSYGSGDEAMCSRVCRGGSWRDVSENLRSAVRSWLLPVDRLQHLGFRVARTIDSRSDIESAQTVGSAHLR